MTDILSRTKRMESLSIKGNFEKLEKLRPPHKQTVRPVVLVHVPYLKLSVFEPAARGSWLHIHGLLLCRPLGAWPFDSPRTTLCPTILPALCFESFPSNRLSIVSFSRLLGRPHDIFENIDEHVQQTMKVLIEVYINTYNVMDGK